MSILKELKSSIMVSAPMQHKSQINVDLSYFGMNWTVTNNSQIASSAEQLERRFEHSASKEVESQVGLISQKGLVTYKI